MTTARPHPARCHTQNPFHALVAISLREPTSESAVDKIVRIARERIDGASAVSLTMVSDGRPRTLAWTSSMAFDLDECQYRRGFGPAVDAAACGAALAIHDTRDETGWADYPATAIERGCLSSLSVPLPSHGGLTGALNLYADQPNAFDDVAREIATAYAAFAAVAVTDAAPWDTDGRRAQAVQRAAQARALVEQAKGILMHRRSVSADEAVAILVRVAQKANCALSEVAQGFIDNVADCAATEG